MQTSLVYFIKHFPEKVCIWKARNVVEAKIVRFGWLALLQLTCVGKSNKPHCFRGIKCSPCRYCAHKKSWMDSELFEEWVREQDKNFVLKGRKLALVIDNCTTHLNIENLKSITLYFHRPNTTSCLQPVDQRVIRSLKCKYRIRIIKTIINAIDNGKQMPSISILEAMKMLAYSWSEVSESTIINYFHKTGKVFQMKMMTPSLHSKVQLTNCGNAMRILFRITLPAKTS